MKTRTTAPAFETRHITTTLEVRAARDDGAIPVAGYAALFNVRSLPMYDFWEGRFIEQIAPGAFTKTLDGTPDVRKLLNHDTNFVLARTAAGNLTLAQDNAGLSFDALMTPTSYAQDLALSMRAGDVTQMSFGFQVVTDDWDLTDEGTPLRTLREIRLFEISPVTFPAYTDTTVGLRAAQLDAVLADCGLADLDADHRRSLYQRLAQDRVFRHLIAPRAGDEPRASEEEPLIDRLRATAPDGAPQTVDPAPVTSHAGRSLELARRRHELNARRFIA